MVTAWVQIHQKGTQPFIFTSIQLRRLPLRQPLRWLRILQLLFGKVSQKEKGIQPKEEKNQHIALQERICTKLARQLLHKPTRLESPKHHLRRKWLRNLSIHHGQFWHQGLKSLRMALDERNQNKRHQVQPCTLSNCCCLWKWKSSSLRLQQKEGLMFGRFASIENYRAWLEPKDHFDRIQRQLDQNERWKNF